MKKITTSDIRVRDQVRMQIQELLVSAGVDHGRVAVEVLFWLPAGFVEAYQNLFMQALHLGDGDDRDKAGEDEGRIKAKVKSEKRGKPGGMSAAGGGKKYKKEWVVKDEEALEVKQRVDRKLMDLIQGEARKVMEAREGGETHGSTPGVGVGGGEGEIVEAAKPKNGGSGKRCRDCGKLMKGDWARCPYLHS